MEVEEERKRGREKERKREQKKGRVGRGDDAKLALTMEKKDNKPL